MLEELIKPTLNLEQELLLNYWQCYDIRTGEVIWERQLLSGESAPTAINLWYEPPAVAGGGTGVPGSQAREPLQPRARLASIGNRLVKYDPWTGAVALNVTGMSGTYYSDPYVLSVQNIGNTTRPNYRLINWSIASETTIFAERIVSNITWPFSSVGTVDYQEGIAVTTTTTDTTSGVEGFFSGSTSIVDHGKYAVRLNDGHWHCWDARTGQKLWVSELSSWPWGIWGIYGVESAYGLLYYPQYDGVVAYDWDTGKVVWRYKYEAQYPYETVYSDNNYPFYDSAVRIADGKLYTSNTEHSASQPTTRGWKFHCINATSGEGIWNITGSMRAGAVADGYLTASNTYDGYMYVFGKGKSATTLSAPQIAITTGQQVVLTGTVLDMSPAQPGVACVSKESMATFMEYLHMQKPIPSNVTVTGVPVSLDAIDPNGNYIHIGDVISDMSGAFGFEWTPEISGKYQITAAFLGDDSYGSSFAGTYMSVVEAPTPTTTSTQTTTTQTPIETYFAISTIAIIIAIAIVGLLMLRKRP
jgi:outer membrane protein assembly factor BamB